MVGAMKKRQVVAIVGPTGSGKTALAIKLAQKFNGEIISADSRAIYRGLDIGTAKPTRKEQRQVPHHLIDIVSVGERFTVVQFQKFAYEKIADITRRGKMPFLVGGTGLYIDAVLSNYQFPPEGDPGLRHHLDMESDERLLKILQTIDPTTYLKIDRQNRRRILRAVEVALQTGQSFQKLRRKGKTRFDYLMLGISLSKRELNKRIDRRFEQWIDSGLVKEVRSVMDETSPDWVASLGLHYKYLAAYIQGDMQKEEALVKSKSALHAYAKRQATWFKRNKEIHWVSSLTEAEKIVRDFLKN